MKKQAKNILGEDLVPCGLDPITGFYRDGCCDTGPEDIGSHTVCVEVTDEAGQAPRVYVQSTHEAALRIIPLEVLTAMAADLN